MQDLHEKGFAIVKNVLSQEQCEALIRDYNADDTYRKTITMERYRFGLGEYKYFRYPLPALIQSIREKTYEQLVPVANKWMEVLKSEIRYPDTHAAFRERCAAAGQEQPAVLILKYGKDGFNTLHQDLYGDVYFPMQAVLFLNQEYSGGEFVLTEQIPRAQSKVTVLKPEMGDMLVFTTSFRPVKGSKGYYRVTMKHGVSPLHSGERYSLGIIFHDARS